MFEGGQYNYHIPGIKERQNVKGKIKGRKGGKEGRKEGEERKETGQGEFIKKETER